jgi:plastocyanin
MGKILGYLGMAATVMVLAISGAVVLASAGSSSAGDAAVTAAAPLSPYPVYTYRVVVPEGTAEKIKYNQRELYMPLSIDLHVGDTIELVNNDSVVQSMGPFRARPGETVRHTFTEPISTVGECTFEPAGMPVYIRVHAADGSPPLIDGKPWGG